MPSLVATYSWVSCAFLEQYKQATSVVIEPMEKSYLVSKGGSGPSIRGCGCGRGRWSNSRGKGTGRRGRGRPQCSHYGTSRRHVMSYKDFPQWQPIWRLEMKPIPLILLSLLQVTQSHCLKKNMLNGFRQGQLNKCHLLLLHMDMF